MAGKGPDTDRVPEEVKEAAAAMADYATPLFSKERKAAERAKKVLPLTVEVLRKAAKGFKVAELVGEPTALRENLVTEETFVVTEMDKFVGTTIDEFEAIIRAELAAQAHGYIEKREDKGEEKVDKLREAAVLADRVLELSGSSTSAFQGLLAQITIQYRGGMGPMSKTAFDSEISKIKDNLRNDLNSLPRYITARRNPKKLLPTTVNLTSIFEPGNPRHQEILSYLSRAVPFRNLLKSIDPALEHKLAETEQSKPVLEPKITKNLANAFNEVGDLLYKMLSGSVEFNPNDKRFKANMPIGMREMLERLIAGMEKILLETPQEPSSKEVIIKG